MPIYEYNCKKCNKHFEIVQRITDETSAKCPNCGGLCRRIISRTSFTLKGGGWYKDGYSLTSGKKTDGSKPVDKKEKTSKSEKKEGN